MNRETGHNMAAMPDLAGLDAAKPLSPLYPFNEPGQPIVLYDRQIGGLAATDVAGVVKMSCARRPSLEWSVGPETPPQFANRSAVTLLLRHQVAGDASMPAHVRGIDGGWSNGAAIGRSDAPLQRVVAHWFNLPNWHGPERLTATEDGGQRWWSGRWVTEAGGWRITIDVRPDHQRIWTGLDLTDIYVMTHVMELCRADGARFTADEAEPLLAALHVGVSFALGRWAAPMLPAGEDGDGKIVWQDWRPLHCDPARVTSPGWWHEKDHETLRDFLRCVIPVFADPDRRTALRFQMMFGILSVGDQGFMEQRVMTGAAGLEHIMWQTLVADGLLTEEQYRVAAAHTLLRRVLAMAKIPVGIEQDLMPTIAQFAADERQRQGNNLDGADVVTQIRNRLVHPRGAQERVYHRSGLLMEVWLLTRHYLVLLILHSLGYNGLYRDLRRTSGWAGDRLNVPWAEM
jgi:hypothetical protein